MISLNNPSLLNISMNIDKNNIHLEDIVKLDADTWGRLDILTMSNYKDLDMLPILLDYNNITDPEDMEIGDLIEIPDLTDLMNNITEINIFGKEEDKTFECPGVIDNDDIKNRNKLVQTGSNTVANSKLKITQKEATYDPINGLLKF